MCSSQSKIKEKYLKRVNYFFIENKGMFILKIDVMIKVDLKIFFYELNVDLMCNSLLKWKFSLKRLDVIFRIEI